MFCCWDFFFIFCSWSLEVVLLLVLFPFSNLVFGVQNSGGSKQMIWRIAKSSENKDLIYQYLTSWPLHYNIVTLPLAYIKNVMGTNIPSTDHAFHDMTLLKLNKISELKFTIGLKLLQDWFWTWITFLCNKSLFLFYIQS